MLWKDTKGVVGRKVLFMYLSLNHAPVYSHKMGFRNTELVFCVSLKKHTHAKNWRFFVNYAHQLDASLNCPMRTSDNMNPDRKKRGRENRQVR